jgi:glycosyltransferase involved in cell wall biosynthesis
LEGLAEVVTVCKALHVPCFFTQCGGAGPSRMLPLNPMILFSEEVKDHLVLTHGFSPDSLKVIPARIDVARIDALHTALDPGLYQAFSDKYGLDPSARIVLRIARMDPPYRTSILQGIDAVARLRRQGLPVQFVHIGYSDKEHAAWVYDEINRRIDSVNTELGGQVAFSAQDKGQPHCTTSAWLMQCSGWGGRPLKPWHSGSPPWWSAPMAMRAWSPGACGGAGLLQLLRAQHRQREAV